MIKLKNEVFENQVFFETVRKINDSEEMTAKDAYWFNRFTKELQPLLASYEEVRAKLLKKFGKENPEQPGNVIIEKENIEPFQKEINSLNNQIATLTIAKISYPENLKLSPKQMSIMENIFSFENLLE